MLPWLLGGLLLGGATALWYFLRKKKKPEEEKPEGASEGDDTPTPTPPPAPIPVKHRTDEAIRKIVNRLQFATGQVIRKQVKVGEETRESIIPTDEVVIRPMRSEAELSRALTGAHAQEDDQFYGAVAARSVPITAYQEQVGLYEDIVEPTRNVVIIIQDVSPSMKEENRIHWAVALDQAIIGKAEDQKAEVHLLPFGSRTGEWLSAKTDEERHDLRINLGRRLHYIDGTAIGYALLEGIRFVSDPSFTERKIVLVTDGTTIFDAESVKVALDEIGAELHTVCTGPSNSQLQHISTHYDHLGDDE
jgi:uncharacterized protein with von Willebrand factor type A (vWA) domain